MGRFVHVEAAPGVITVLAAWMVDAAVCARTAAPLWGDLKGGKRPDCRNVPTVERTNVNRVESVGAACLPPKISAPVTGMRAANLELYHTSAVYRSSQFPFGEKWSF